MFWLTQYAYFNQNGRAYEAIQWFLIIKEKEN